MKNTGFLAFCLPAVLLAGCSGSEPTTEGNSFGLQDPSTASHLRAPSAAAEPQPPEGATPVTIAELEAAYDANEAAAQTKYGKQTLYVTGTVESIKLGMSDKPVVSFVSKSVMSADLRFAPAHEKDATGLQKGETRSFICKGVSEVLGSPSLDQCQLAS